jgi:hypothetical protein
LRVGVDLLVVEAAELNITGGDDARTNQLR